MHVGRGAMADNKISANARSVFQAVNEDIRADDAARNYGVRIGRGGMACCPFHNDKNPSMKIDQRFHCFGCGADGDVIDFAARFFGISKLDAATKLADDFGVPYSKRYLSGNRLNKRMSVKRCSRGTTQKRKTMTERCLATQERFFHILANYYHLLIFWKETEAPSGPEDVWNERFCEALMELPIVEYLMDEILAGTPESKIDLMNCYRGRVKEYERRLGKYSAGETGGV